MKNKFSRNRNSFDAKCERKITDIYGNDVDNIIIMSTCENTNSHFECRQMRERWNWWRRHFIYRLHIQMRINMAWWISKCNGVKRIWLLLRCFFHTLQSRIRPTTSMLLLQLCTAMMMMPFQLRIRPRDFFNTEKSMSHAHGQAYRMEA